METGLLAGTNTVEDGWQAAYTWLACQGQYRVGLMLGRRRRRRPSINPTQCQRFVHADVWSSYWQLHGDRQAYDMYNTRVWQQVTKQVE